MQKMAAGAAGASGLVLAGGGFSSPRASGADLNKPGNHHLAWVWNFTDDGSPEQIRSHLAYYGVGVLLKSHDGVDWMSRYDRTGLAISGGNRVRELAEFFETGGVPFHCWCVVKGQNPIREAHMASEVLHAGARSLVLDLEPSDGGYYWQGTPESALTFGRELRRLNPNGFVSMAPDPRPWQVAALPCREFGSFCNEVAPQTYWPMFNSSANYRLLRDWGFEVGPDGVTPQLILDVTRQVFDGYNLPIKPVGAGNSDIGSWHRFVQHAQGIGMSAVSVWRFGVANPDVWTVLGEKRPNYNEFYGPDWAPPPPPAPEPVAAVQAAPAPDKFATLPPISEPEESLRLGTAPDREATSKLQGIEDLYKPAQPRPFKAPSREERIKSFWADPRRNLGGR
jgi:hypothetical protein